MPHVITQACCADASCVFACPVNCIHPTPDEPDFHTAEMLYIDPETCVDCGACVRACPVGAIVPHTQLTDDEWTFASINAAFYDTPRPRRLQARIPGIVRLSPTRSHLRVAIVGSGPAALYAADELLKQPGVKVTVLDRLYKPYGLVRSGVAPDHPRTRSITRLFSYIEDEPGFSYLLGVEVGTDVTVEELAAHHHAVVFATGASTDRRLNIVGEDLPGSVTATDFVAWYNNHPDHAAGEFDLDHERAIIIGNGNVALDVARIMASDPEVLATTDIAPHALNTLRNSAIREIIVLARRGPAQAAFTLPELVGLASREDIDIVVENAGDLEPESHHDMETREKLRLLREIAERPLKTEHRRIVLRFCTAPLEIEGATHVTGLRVADTQLVTDDDGQVRAETTNRTDIIMAGLVLRSVGYRGVPVPGAPFDAERAVIPNHEGRVLEAPGGQPIPGQYVVGWIKRGPTGFIGTNKSCSRDTVNHLLADHNAGLLPEPHAVDQFARTMLTRKPRLVDLAAWQQTRADRRLTVTPRR